MSKSIAVWQERGTIYWLTWRPFTWQGFFWVANRPDLVFEWSTAGASRRFAPYGRWLASMNDGAKSDPLLDDITLGVVAANARFGGTPGDPKSGHASGDARSGTVTDGAEFERTTGGASSGTVTCGAKSGDATGDARSGTVTNGISSHTSAGTQSYNPSAATSASEISAPPIAADAGGKERLQRLVFIGIDLQKVRGCFSSLLHLLCKQACICVIMLHQKDAKAYLPFH